MQFHFEKTLEKRYEPQVTVTNETPAWLMICLAESIKDWIGQSPRIFCKSEEPYLQFGYEVLTFPVGGVCTDFRPADLCDQSGMACAGIWNGKPG